MAGYSGTPLARKLGFKANHVAALLNAPPAFDNTLGALPAGVVIAEDMRAAPAYDIIVYFTKSEADLRRRFPTLARKLHSAGGLWIAWPKKTSGVATDLKENVVRAVGLEAGLVDNKVCAIDDTWSGLRFVIRLQDRSASKRA